VAAVAGWALGRPLAAAAALRRQRAGRIAPRALVAAGLAAACGSGAALLVAAVFGCTQAMMAGPACSLVAAVFADLL
jgi:hypothetical protein